MVKLSFTLLLVSLFSFNAFGQIHFVNQNVSGGLDNGTSWSNAFSDVQDALDIAAKGDAIWVAKGTYYPTAEFSLSGSTGTRIQTFNVTDSLRVYGGFVGNESPATFDLSTRDFILNETILSGNIGSLADSTDNCYHVVTTKDVTAFTTVDGFTIRDGSAPNFGSDARGGGWLNNGEGSVSNPTIRNCVFTNNAAGSGAGLYSAGGFSGESNPLIENCTFYKNRATSRGGGAYFGGFRGVANPTINNCKFIENVATSFAGAIYFTGEDNGEASPTIFNCEFVKNISTNISTHALYFKSDDGVAEPIISRCKFRESGGIEFQASTGSAKATVTNCAFYESENYHIAFTGALPNASPSFTNCTFTGARFATIQMTVFETGTTPVSFTNCIFNEDSFDLLQGSAGFDNTNVNVSYSMVRETSFGSINNNILGIPKLYNQAKGVLIPSKCSAVIDAGDPSVTLATDASGNPRVVGAAIDMGAYEYQSDIVYVKADATGGNDGSNWENALTDLQDALVSPCDTSQHVWVAKGVYLPTQDNDPDISFAVPDSIQLYGGFVGNEPIGYNKALRNFQTNESLLSGDIGVQNDSTDNTFHVVITTSVSNKTLIDGFKIAYGYARSIGSQSGGGWLNTVISEISRVSSPVLRNCTFYRNTAFNGGAFSNELLSSNFNMEPLFEYCLFNQNYGTGAGGAFINLSLNPTAIAGPVFNYCDFVANDGDDRAGAFYNAGNGGQAVPTFNGCRFEDNIARSGGGAIVFQNPNSLSKSILSNCVFQNNGKNHIRIQDGLANEQPEFMNCTFFGATSHAIELETWGGGNSPTKFQNCIFWNNNGDILGGSQGADNSRIAISFSNVEEASFAPINNNLSTDPQFTNPSNYDLSLKPCSPLIDQGSNTGITVLDVLKKTRNFNAGIVDMGAYEFNGFYLNNPSNLLLNDVVANTDYLSTSNIIATNKVPNPLRAVYKAKTSIELNAGFEANSGAYFLANIEDIGCP